MARAQTAARRQAAGVELDDREFRRAIPREFKRIEVANAQELQRLGIMVQNEARKLSAVDTGRLRSSIQHVPGEDSRGPYVDVGTNVEYAPFVEYGTVHSPAQPFMRPALLLAIRSWRGMTNAEASPAGRELVQYTSAEGRTSMITRAQRDNYQRRRTT